MLGLCRFAMFKYIQAINDTYSLLTHSSLCELVNKIENERQRQEQGPRANGTPIMGVEL